MMMIMTIIKDPEMLVRKAFEFANHYPHVFADGDNDDDHCVFADDGADVNLV